MKIRRKGVLAIMIVCLMLGGCVGWFIHESRKLWRKSQRMDTQVELCDLHNAITNYSDTFGSLAEKENAAVVTALTGQNPGKIIFIAVNKDRLDASGCYLDCWRTPYQIQITVSNLTVRSAGPNRVFEDHDDMTVNESLISKAVQPRHAIVP